jgi:hypothetical protein
MARYGFASYGGGVYKYDGLQFTVFNTKTPSLELERKCSTTTKIYVGTELGCHCG